MTKTRTAIIIGGGHNGLVCAAKLAKAGFAVTLLEARRAVGGAIAKRELGHGFSSPGLAHGHYNLHPDILKDLNLPSRAGATIDTIALARDGGHLRLGSDAVDGQSLSAADKAAYSAFKTEYRAYAKALEPLLKNKPPRLRGMDFKDKRTLAQIGWSLRMGLGLSSMREFLRVGGVNIYDVLNEHFESEALKGAIALDAVLGHHMGPRTPTTVLTYLQRLFGETHSAYQPAVDASLVKQLVRAAEAAGVVIKTEARVTALEIDDQRVVGVRLVNGEYVEADIVASSLDAKATFLNLAGPPNMDAMFVHRISKTRTNGDVAKVYLGLSKAPAFNNLSADDLTNRLVVAPDMRYLERAFNAAKYGEFSQAPALEILTPSAHDPSLAPDGGHVLSINASFAPYELREGWSYAREKFADLVVATLDAYAPGIGKLILHRDVLTPVDIEREFGATGGHWHHGEMTIDQSFMMRPVHGAAQYDTPIDGLFLCGAAAHPGGGVTGLPGWNAARRILDMAKERP